MKSHPKLPPGVPVERIAQRSPDDPARRLLSRLREEAAVEGYLRYWTRARIADDLEARGLGRVTPQAVGKMIRRAERRVLDNMAAELEAEKRRQVRALGDHYRVLRDAWDKSTEDAQVARQKTVEGDGPLLDDDGNPIPGTAGRGRKEEVLEVRGRAGHTPYLTEARSTLADIRKILGLDAPERREITGPGGAAIQVHSAPASLADEIEALEALNLTDEELDAVAIYLSILQRKTAAAREEAPDGGRADG